MLEIGRGEILMRPTLLLFLLAFGAGCSAATEPSSPSLPEGAAAFSPSPAFRDWWLATESCAGLSGSFSSIEWYVIPGVETFDPGTGSPVVGMWSRDGDRSRITLAGAWQQSEFVARHEMLHALIGQSGHPVLYFETRCGLTWAEWQGEAGPSSAG